MQFPKSLHAEGWHAQMPAPQSLPEMPLASPDSGADEAPPRRSHRRFHALVVIVAIGALVSSAGLDVVDDPRPLDVQLSTAMHKAGDLLKQLQQWVSRGLQVSLRAVADGRDVPAARVTGAPGDATVLAQASFSESAEARPAPDRDQPVMPDLNPKPKEPHR